MALGENASTILEIVVLFLLASCLVLGYSGFRLLRQTPDRRRNSSGGVVGQKSIAELRMLFTQISQISRSHGPPTPSGEGGLNMAGPSQTSDGSMLMPGPIRPRASSHSFFTRGRYEEIQEEANENEDSK